MKKLLDASSEEKIKVALKHRSSVSILQSGLIKSLITAIIALCLFTVVLPANASTGSGKVRYVECKSKGGCLSCPAFSKKFSPLVNKSHARRSRSRHLRAPIL